jgi:hypothetical protein
MILNKHCESRGCREYPCFGFGTPSKGHMRWACARHKGLIGFGEGLSPSASHRTAEGQAITPSRPSAPIPAQRSLF